MLGGLGIGLACPVFTVAGTNGKGSTCAMLESILRAAGYRTGLYTSPHLRRYSERVRFAGREIDEGALRAALDTRPDVIAARSNLNAADNALDVARAARYRDVTLGPVVGRGSNGVSNTTTLGLSLSIPIFTERIVEGNVMVASGQRSDRKSTRLNSSHRT